MDFEWVNVVGWILSVLTAAGNGFVVFIVAKQRRLHSAANWLILSLAVADFGVGAAIFPSGYLCIKSTACNWRVYMAVHWFFVHSSVANLCTLTWDRYTAIVHPFKYITCMTARRPGKVILIAWLIPLLISLSLFLGMYATNSLIVLKILRLIGVSAFDILSCTLLLYGVGRILFVARTKRREDYAIKSNQRAVGPNTELQEQQNLSLAEFAPRHRPKKHNTGRFLIAIVSFFLGCHAVINYLVLRIMFSDDVSDTAGKVLTLLLVLNSAVNPLVYAFMKRDIKQELRKLFCGKERRNVYSLNEG